MKYKVGMMLQHKEDRDIRWAIISISEYAYLRFWDLVNQTFTLDRLDRDMIIISEAFIKEDDNELLSLKSPVYVLTRI